MADMKNPIKIGTQPVARVADSHSFLQKLLTWFNQNPWSGFSAILGLMSFLVYFPYLFGSKLFLFTDIGSDTINFNYPHLVSISDYLRTEGIPRWSFNQGLGQNIFPMGLIGDPSGPLNLILFLFGRDHLPYVLVYVEIIKIICAGLLFFFYLRLLSLSNLTCMVGGILFSFSGYMILGGTWYIFSTEAVYVALMLFAFERFFKKRKWSLLPIPFALMGFFQPFWIYLHALLLFAYGTFRFVEEDSGHWKKWLVFELQLAACVLLGAMMSGLYLLSHVVEMLQSPRVAGPSSFFHILTSQSVVQPAPALHNVTALLRIFSNDLAGTGNSFRGWQNYLEAPIFYAGLLTVLLLTQLAANSSGRKRFSYLVMFALICVPILFPYFRYVYWGFTGDYYRSYSLLFITIALYLSVRSLETIITKQKINLLVLLFTLVGIAVILFIPFSNKDIIIQHDLKWIVFLFCILEAAVLAALARRVARARQVLLLLVICEAIIMSYRTVQDRSVVKKSNLQDQTLYKDAGFDAVRLIRTADRSFYRLSKDFFSGPAIHQSLNDAKVQNYFGSSSYYSFNQKYYVDFLSTLGIIDPTQEFQTRWLAGLIDQPLLLSLTGCKYALTKRTDDYLSGWGYKKLGTVGDVRVFQNNFALPLAFTYQQFISREHFLQIAGFQKQKILLQACVLESHQELPRRLLTALTLPDTLRTDLSFIEYEKFIRTLKQDTMTITQFGQNKILGTINAKSDKLLFFSIPYDTGWHITLDSLPVSVLKVNIGFLGILIPAGPHTIELNYQPPYLWTGLCGSCLGLLIFCILLIRVKHAEAK